MLKWWNRWKAASADRDRERISHWISTGQADYRTGVGPNMGPFKYSSRAYIWWICGWTIAYQMDKEDNDA